MICKDYEVSTADTFAIHGVAVTVFVYIIITNVSAAPSAVFFNGTPTAPLELVVVVVVAIMILVVDT
jgi:hypothetical protein